MLVDAIFKVYAILTLADAMLIADAILTHLAKVKIRVRLMIDCLKLKRKKNFLLHCYDVVHFLIK